MKIRILIAPKKSKLQWDMDRLGLSAAGVLARCKRHGLDTARIRVSHERQMKVLETVRKMFPEAAVIPQNKLSRRVVERADLILAVGGDNHFQHVSHFVDRQIIAGVNSDPQSSEGSLTGYTPETLGKLAAVVRSAKLQVEEWARLRVELDGKTLEPLALSEVYIGEAARSQMSRYKIAVGRRSEIQKSSGLLAVTGAGSGGWYSAAGGVPFARTRKGFAFLATESYRGRLSKPSLVKGMLARDQKLRVSSRNDGCGVVVVDAQWHHAFGEGCTAVVSVGTPLRVLQP